MNITCRHCFTTNRIPTTKDIRQANCGKCKEKIYLPTPFNLSNSTFAALVERNDLPIVIDFWASWCGPCQHMAPVFERVANVTEALLFAKLNTESAQQISAQLNIRSIPTLIFYFKGKEVDRISGALNELQLKQWLTQCQYKKHTSV